MAWQSQRLEEDVACFSDDIADLSPSDRKNASPVPSCRLMMQPYSSRPLQPLGIHRVQTATRNTLPTASLGRNSRHLHPIMLRRAHQNGLGRLRRRKSLCPSLAPPCTLPPYLRLRHGARTCPWPLPFSKVMLSFHGRPACMRKVVRSPLRVLILHTILSPLADPSFNLNLIIVFCFPHAHTLSYTLPLSSSIPERRSKLRKPDYRRGALQHD